MSITGAFPATRELAARRARAMASARAAPRDDGRRVESVAARVLVSAASVACATTVTNPLDVLKVRLQTDFRSICVKTIDFS